MPHECTTCGRRFENGSKQMLSGCPDCGGNKFQFQPAGRESGDSAEGASAAETDPTPPDDVDARSTADGPTTADAPSTVDATSDAHNASDTTPTPEEVAEADVEREMPELTKDADAESAAADAADAVERDPAQMTFDDEFWDAEIDDDGADENRAQSDARSSSTTIDEINEARRKMAEAEEERFADVEDEPESSGRGTPQGPPTETPSGEETAEFDISGAVGPEDGDPVEKQPVAGSAPESEEPVTNEDPDLKALREELNDQFESIKITAPGQYELNLMELYDRKEYIISLQEDGRYVIEMADDYGVDDG